MSAGSSSNPGVHLSSYDNDVKNHKHPVTTTLVKSPSHDDDIESTDLSFNDVFNSTAHDIADMRRLGKKQELRRGFKQASTISLITVLVSTWGVLFVANQQGLAQGGRAGLFWSYLWTMAGFGLIATSLAEMASLAPTAAGMYHWYVCHEECRGEYT